MAMDSLRGNDIKRDRSCATVHPRRATGIPFAGSCARLLEACTRAGRAHEEEWQHVGVQKIIEGLELTLRMSAACYGITDRRACLASG